VGNISTCIYNVSRHQYVLSKHARSLATSHAGRDPFRCDVQHVAHM